MYELEALEAIKEGRPLEHIDEIDPGAVVTFDGWPATVMTFLLEENRLDDIKALLANKSAEEISAIFNVDLGHGSTPLTNLASYIIFSNGKSDLYTNPGRYADLICYLVENGVNVEGLQEYLKNKMQTYNNLVSVAACAMLVVIDQCLQDESKKTHPYALYTGIDQDQETSIASLDAETTWQSTFYGSSFLINHNLPNEKHTGIIGIG